MVAGDRCPCIRTDRWARVRHGAGLLTVRRLRARGGTAWRVRYRSYVGPLRARGRPTGGSSSPAQGARLGG